MKGKTMLISGWILTGLVALFLLWDSGSKILEMSFAVKGTTELGFTAAQVRIIGIVLVICTVLYLLPPTSVFGAVLLTGYLGGTVAVHLLNGNPLFSHTLFGVYIGLMMWGGVYLRVEQIRSLLPIFHYFT